MFYTYQKPFVCYAPFHLPKSADRSLERRGSRVLKKRTTRARLGTANGERFVASSYLVGSKNVTDEV